MSFKQNPILKPLYMIKVPVWKSLYVRLEQDLLCQGNLLGTKIVLAFYKMKPLVIKIALAFDNQNNFRI